MGRVGTLEPGSVFGELALITNQPRKATIITITPVTSANFHRNGRFFERRLYSKSGRFTKSSQQDPHAAKSPPQCDFQGFLLTACGQTTVLVLERPVFERLVGQMGDQLDQLRRQLHAASYSYGRRDYHKLFSHLGACSPRFVRVSTGVYIIYLPVSI